MPSSSCGGSFVCFLVGRQCGAADTYAGESRDVGEDGDYGHGDDEYHHRGVGGIGRSQACDAAREASDRGHHHSLGALHESDLALYPNAFGAGADVADHDGADQGHESDQGTDGVACHDEEIAQRAQG